MFCAIFCVHPIFPVLGSRRCLGRASCAYRIDCTLCDHLAQRALERNRLPTKQPYDHLHRFSQHQLWYHSEFATLMASLKLQQPSGVMGKLPFLLPSPRHATSTALRAAISCVICRYNSHTCPSRLTQRRLQWLTTLSPFLLSIQHPLSWSNAPLLHALCKKFPVAMLISASLPYSWRE